MMIIGFSLVAPLGIFIGALIESSILLTAIFFSLSAGTFLYIATTEIIVEEFSLSK